ncbi:MAG TPA: universal stress protein [Terriglobales bacterium]|nr:universal stress protein [Terriglobales bacterium]
MKVERILAPTDLSELSAVAVRTAFDLAQTFGAELIVLHVVDYEEKDFPLHHGAEKWIAEEGVNQPIRDFISQRTADLDEYLNRCLPEVGSGPRIRKLVRLGAPADTIIDTAAKEEADMVAMCTHGRTGLKRLLIGNVTEQVLRGVSCPVLSIHPREPQASS